MTTYGTDITAAAGTNQNKQKIKVQNNVEFNGTATIIKTCDWAERSTLLPTLNSAHPTLGASYILTDTDVEELPGGICKATLTYTCQYNSIPSTSYIEQTSQEKIKIQFHPDFNTWITSNPGVWDPVAEAFTNPGLVSGVSMYGVEDFVVGNTTVTMTEYFSSMPSSNHTNIGMLQVPESSYGTSANWLIIGSTRQQQGYYWVRETTFLYSAVPYNTNIYTTVT